MSKSKINIDAQVLDCISNSVQINDAEKVSFLKFVWYMTISEKRELIATL